MSLTIQLFNEFSFFVSPHHPPFRLLPSSYFPPPKFFLARGRSFPDANCVFWCVLCSFPNLEAFLKSSFFSFCAFFPEMCKLPPSCFLLLGFLEVHDFLFSVFSPRRLLLMQSCLGDLSRRERRDKISQGNDISVSKAPD